MADATEPAEVDSIMREMNRACAKALGIEYTEPTSREPADEGNILSQLDEKDWLFITGGMFDEEIDLETRIAILNILKDNEGKLELSDLMDVGIYTEEISRIAGGKSF